MKGELKFSCKDTPLAKYYEATYHRAFTDELRGLPDDADEPTLDVLVQSWNARMIAEATRQEHYDYTTDELGTRHRIEVDLLPKLLIPSIEIVS